MTRLKKSIHKTGDKNSDQWNILYIKLGREIPEVWIVMRSSQTCLAAEVSKVTIKSEYYFGIKVTNDGYLQV